MTLLLPIAAALYLAASIAGAIALSLRQPRAGRAALFLLAGGALAHAGSFVALHTADPVPQLTELPQALSFMAWVAVVAFLVIARRGRAGGLVVLMGPLAFLGAFVAARHAPDPELVAQAGGWPHAHVLLAGGGLSLLAVAAVAGGFYLIESRRLKRKRVTPGGTLPSLEALDRINAVALAVGFPLLTLGVITGMVWANGARGALFTGSAHEAWNALAWLIYAVLVASRFGAHRGARQAAAFAVVGFAFLLFAVVGVGFLA